MANIVTPNIAKVSQQTLLTATLATIILFLVAYAIATSFAFEMFATSRTYSSSGVPMGDTNMSSVMDGVLEGILAAYLMTITLTTVSAGLLFKRYLHLKNGMFTVLTAQLLLTIIWPVVYISDVIIFILSHIYVWLPMLFLYLYIFYALVLRRATPKASTLTAKASPWYIK